MAQSESINELAAALSKAQGKFGHITKNKAVKFGQTNYAYADLADSFDECREALSENGLAIVQPIQPMGNGWVIITKLMHSSGQWLDSMLPINIEGKPQDLGSRITYMRKYQLWSILALATDDDDGQSEAKEKHEENERHKNIKTESKSNDHQIKPTPTQENNAEKIGKPEIVSLTTLIQHLNEESAKSFYDWISNDFKAKTLQDIPKSVFEQCMVLLKAKIKFQNDKNKMAVA